MSDINFHFEWWQILLFSAIASWPGLLLGAAVGALAWRRRRILGGILGAIIGDIAWAAVAIYLH
jgi:putative Mn2+ efflux pump MntP